MVSIKETLLQIKSNIQTGSVLDNLKFFPDGFNLAVLIILSLGYFYLLFKLLKRYLPKFDIDSSLRCPPLKELLIAAGAYLLPLVLVYQKFIFKFSEGIVAGGGDSLNHFARLVYSKKLLTEGNRDYYHWDNVLYPEGLTAFDGAPTFFNDIIHLVLSNFLTSPFIYNLINLSTFIIGGVGCYCLCRFFNFSKFASFFTGFIYSFNQLHGTSSQYWLNIVHIDLIPWFFLCVFLYLQRFEKKYLIYQILIWTIIGYQSLNYLIIVGIIYFIINLVLLFECKTLKSVLPFLGVSISTLILMLPWIFPMVTGGDKVQHSFFKPHWVFSTDLLLIFSPGKYSLFSPNEKYIGAYVGIFATIISLISFKNKKSKTVIFGAIISFVFSLGTLLKFNNFLLPIANVESVFSFLPFLKSLRAPERFMMIFFFFWGIIVSTSIEQVFRRKKALFYGAALLVSLDLCFFIPETNFISYHLPKIYKKIPAKGPLLELPLNNQNYWVFSTIHQNPIVYGYLFTRGKEKKLFHQLVTQVLEDKSISVENLKSKGVKYIVSHRYRDEDLYPHLFGFEKRKNRVYKGVADYIDTKELDKLRLIANEGDSYLYEIR